MDLWGSRNMLDYSGKYGKMYCNSGFSKHGEMHNERVDKHGVAR